MLIIACGNRQRGDDAAGFLAAEHLQSQRIEAHICAGEHSDLIELWADAADVIVIDSVVTGAPAGTVHFWDARSPIPHGKSSGSSHGLGVGEAIELSRALGCLPARLRVYGIEGKNFEMGAELTPDVKAGVEEVVRRIAAEVNR